MTYADLTLIYETFLVVKNSSAYNGSDVQLGFKQVFADADKDGDGHVEKADFPTLIDGYFGSKHIRPTASDYEEYFKKIDLN